MTRAKERAGEGVRNRWRIARWMAAPALLLTPLVMMRLSDQWHWTAGTFLLAGVAIGGVELLYELAERASPSRAYRAGAAVALVTSFLAVWTAIVRDDGNGIGFFLVVMAAAVGSFAAGFRAAGVARAMFGVAAMQAVIGIAIATAPSTANMPDGPLTVLMSASFLALLWLISAAFFRAAAKDAAAPSIGERLE